MAGLGDELWGTDDDALIYSPIHAWRILGQLKSEQAIEPILAMLDPMDKRGDDWYLEEYQYVFRNIGPKAIPALKKTGTRQKQNVEKPKNPERKTGKKNDSTRKKCPMPLWLGEKIQEVLYGQG